MKTSAIAVDSLFLPLHTVRKVEKFAALAKMTFDEAACFILGGGDTTHFCPAGDTTPARRAQDGEDAGEQDRRAER